ncbi:MAG: fumarylacetoacetate hydrolase family protein [Ardenticatenales bacterium]|nr:fumarylacetoacetate hydrolase family protein [Ardenticatenales bacterium]
MKVIRYLAHENQPAWGLLEEGSVFALMGSPFEAHGRGAAVGRLDEVTLLAPVAPSKVLCVGRNYAAHAAELGNEVPTEPLLFLKPPSSIIGPEESIRLTPLSEKVEHEGELVLVIGQRCRALTEENAMQVIFGYTCGNDVTARDLQRKDPQWTRGKGFDTFCPVGPWIISADEFDPTQAQVRTLVNGEVRQDGNTSLFIFSLPHLLSYITAVMTLEPGDIVMTGTPAGVGPLQAGDVVEVEVAGIGTLRNTVE